MKAQVSVIIPTRDRPGLLRHALASVAAQCQEGVRAEAVVVNDAGVDVSDVIAEVGGMLPVRLITFDRHRGLPAARNAGLAAAAGAAWAFLDDDDVYLSGHLHAALRALEVGADVAYAACPVVEQRVAVGTAPAAVRAAAWFDFPFDPRLLLAANFIPITAAVMRADPGVRFDEELTVEEDWDLWLGLLHRGRMFAYLPAPSVVYHRPRAAQSLTVDPTSGTGGRLDSFRTTHRHLMQRWPVPAGSTAAVCRRHLLTAYELAQAELDHGRPLAHFYFERVLRVLADVLTGRLDETRLPARLSWAVTESESPR